MDASAGARTPIRITVLVTRRPDLSPEQFREGYETSHARLAVRLFGHLWLSYCRNYVVAARNFAGLSDGPGFDAVSEFVLRDADAFAEMARIGAAHSAEIRADEERWFNRSRCWTVTGDTVHHDLSDFKII